MDRTFRGTPASDGGAVRRGLPDLDALALAYLAAPVVVFVAGWIVVPLGPIAALALIACIAGIARRAAAPRSSSSAPLCALVLIVAIGWCLLGGLGHVLYANPDWIVRDAVLLDLVRDAWPVRYHGDGGDLLLRTPVGYFLPAALVGKAFGLRAGELALMAWTMIGVALVLALMVRDRPTIGAACVRIGVFVLFSGMDIVPTLVRRSPVVLGSMIEWWARFLQYPSQTTALFWAPNHTLPGWIATAWLLGREPRTIPIECAVLFVVLSPIWSPLTAAGSAVLVAALIGWRLRVDRATTWRALTDRRVLLVVVTCVALVYPYLTAGSEAVGAGLMADIPWVGDDVVPRYIEFVLVEFVGIALLLLIRRPRDPLLWAAVVLLLALPIFRFGPYNDLVMRTSCAALTLMAIQTGRWLSMPSPAAEHRALRPAAVVLLLIGAVTPFMELVRPLITPPWPMNAQASVPDVTRGAHYLVGEDHWWLQHVLRPAAAP